MSALAFFVYEWYYRGTKSGEVLILWEEVSEF
jgi:hypothetical protein